MPLDTSPFSTTVTVTGEPTINVEKPGLFGLATAAPLRTSFTTPLIPGSTAQAPTEDSPVIQALKKRNVIDDGGDGDLPPSWTPPPTGRTRGLSSLIGEKVVDPAMNLINRPGETIKDFVTEQIINPVTGAIEGITGPDPLGYVKETVSENPFSTLGFIVSSMMKATGIGALPAFAISIVGNILDALTGSNKEYMQGIQHGLFSPDAPFAEGGPGDESGMGVYGTNPLTGKFEFLGRQHEVGKYWAAVRAQYESRFTDPFYQEDWDRPLPTFTDQDDWDRPPPQRPTADSTVPVMKRKTNPIVPHQYPVVQPVFDSPIITEKANERADDGIWTSGGDDTTVSETTTEGARSVEGEESYYGHDW